RLKGAPSSALLDVFAANDVEVKDYFDQLGTSVLEMPASAVDAVAVMDEVAFVAPDDVVEAMGHVTSTTGAEGVRSQVNSSGAAYKLDGTGIGIAILDSGINVLHKEFLNSLSKSRVVYSQDFTGQATTLDYYGHGT